jgi:hypothetical protein
MPFLAVRPEQTGRSTDPEGHGPYRFDWWLGDDLVEAHPDLLVTDGLRQSLERLPKLSGFSLESARVEESEFFKEKNGGRHLPTFWRLLLTGTPGVHDMAVAPDRVLVVSGRALALLLGHVLEQAEISQFRRKA